MKRNVLTKIVLGIVALFLCAGVVFAEFTYTNPPASGSVTYREGYLLVRFSEQGTTSAANSARQAVLTAAGGGTIQKMYSSVPGLALVKLPVGANTQTAYATFRTTIGVVYAEPDYIGKFASIPNDTRFTELWGLHNTGQNGGTPDADIDAPEAWDLATGSTQVVVAICDSGLDYTHPDLAANVWINQAEQNGTPGIDDDNNGYVDDIHGYDFAFGDAEPDDNVGHGTHVAGTVGAAGNNGRGVAGINWSVKLMACKIGDANGILISDAIEGIQYAVAMGAKVMNHSWGGYGYSQALYDAIAASQAAGLLFVAAAGNGYNDNDTFPAYPASYDLSSIISVMATNSLDQKADFSNWGLKTVDIGAPGVNILSTLPGNSYASWDGTSMACPHVSGAAALVWSAVPSLTAAEVKQALLTTADKKTSLNGLSTTAARLNIANALKATMTDKLAPSPDPMVWKVEPVAVGLQTIYMEATTATDRSGGVEYFFDCNVDTFDSGWQASPIYYRGGFTTGGTYQFSVKARDSKNNVGTGSKDVSVVLPATLPLPYPSPEQWKADPRKISNNRIGMEALKAYGEADLVSGKWTSRPIEYKFICTMSTDKDQTNFSAAKLTKNWSTTTVYNPIVSTIAAPGAEYRFELQIRQAANPALITDPAGTERTVFMTPPAVVRTVGVAPYLTIQLAINSSNHGDVVVVPQGVYRETNIDFKGKAITVRSENPDNPAIVAATVIDCEDIWHYLPTCETRRAFVFTSGEGRSSVLAGITIKNATAIDDAQMVDSYGSVVGDPDQGNRFTGAERVVDGRDALGGAVLIGSPSSTSPVPASPTIRNCIFMDCSANGRYGRSGLDGIDSGAGTPGGHADRGGNGGNAYGGAIYVVQGSAPLIKQSQFQNCHALGGLGGNGGNGGDAGNPSDALTNANGLRGGDGGDAGLGGCAWGGAIYFEPNCLPELYGVSVKDSFVKVGEAGHGGNGGNGSSAKGIGNGGDGGNGGAGGDLRAPNSYAGAVFFGDNTNVVIDGCVFDNCKVIAELSGNYYGGNGGNGGNGAGGAATGTVGGDGGNGGPAYFVPDKMRDLGGARAVGGDGGNGGTGNTAGAGGQGGFRLGHGGVRDWNQTPQQTGIWPSNMYYMAYYWEDANRPHIDNPVPADDPNANENDTLLPWSAEFIQLDPNHLSDPKDPNYLMAEFRFFWIFYSSYSPFYGFIEYNLNIVPNVLGDPNDPNTWVADYIHPVSFSIEKVGETPLTPVVSNQPNTGACAGANYYGENSVITMKDTIVSNNASFANHGGGELYDKGCQATFDDCTFENNITRYDMAANPDPNTPRDPGTDYRFEGFGGGLFMDQPVDIVFNDCQFTGNNSLSGGAVYCNFGPSSGNYTPHFDLIGCTFTDNKADFHPTYSYAGAVYAGNSFDAYEEFYFNNFTGNPIYFHTSKYADHGYISFYYTVLTNLWSNELEADHILWGMQSPVYQVSVTNSTFENNISLFGSGLDMDAANVNIKGSQFMGNTAQIGAGGFLYACDVNAVDNLFDKNIGSYIETQAYADEQGSDSYCSGAGLYLGNSDIWLSNNQFTANQTAGYGGGLYINGAPLATYPQQLVNNLFVENQADFAGGAIVAENGSDVDVLNCTFVDNTIDPGITYGAGGSILVLPNDTFVNVTNTIFWGNQAKMGSQIAIGDPLDDPLDLRYSTLYIDYSDVQGGESGAFVGDGGGAWLWYGENNITTDPNFALTTDSNEPKDRTFYLSQIAAGQLADSNCLNTGLGDVSVLNTMIGFSGTTRTDHIADANAVDMGYHYDSDPNSSLPVLKYVLNMSVYTADLYPHGSLTATWYPGGSMTVSKDPNSATIQQGVVVTLTAEPNDPNYRVARWVGTDDDSSYANTNTVTMGGNRTVMVEFELAVPRNRLVPSDYPTIMKAIEAARDGDTVILSPRPNMGYPIETSGGEGIDLMGKNIVITSEDPNNPAVVAATILDCRGTRYVPQRAFQIRNGEDPNTVIQGLTIRNAYWIGDLGADGAIVNTRPYPTGPDPQAPPRANYGEDAAANAYGGAILIENGSSPTIRNCVFDNCRVVAAYGGDGDAGFGYYPPDPPAGVNTDGQSGGHGGSGTGNGYGGVIAILDKSSPLIQNCIFTNNSALGGCGGNGGKGGNAAGSGRESWGGNGGDATGDGVGGAIFADANCNARIVDCNFVKNYARQGQIGYGGAKGTGGTYSDQYSPYSPSWAGYNGSAINYGGIRGGAVVLGKGATTTIENSTFDNNKAYIVTLIDWSSSGGSDSTRTEEFLTYTRGGAIMVDDNSTVAFEDLQLTNNRPMAIEIRRGSTITMDRLDFTGNADFDRDYTNADLEPEQIVQMYEDYYPEYIDYSAGAVYIDANVVSVDFNDCSFTDNLSRTYGGAINAKGNFKATDCSFGGNEAMANGGAIDMYYYISDPNVRTLVMKLDRCVFTNNKAGIWGGAIHSQNFEATINESCFVNNTAWSGGAMYLSEGKLTLGQSLFSSNIATGLSYYYRSSIGEGLGGALACMNTSASVVDSVFVDNRTEGGLGQGGAIAFVSGNATISQTVDNCLFNGNYAELTGGAMAMTNGVKPTINNCTISGNTVGDAAESQGGGIFISLNSFATLTNSILTDNVKYAVYEQPTTGNAKVKNCLFFSNPNGDYFDAQTASPMTVSQLNAVAGNAANISATPMFVTGDLGSFYLNQAGPAVNAGTASASYIFGAAVDNYTTDNTSTPAAKKMDTGTVDLGYHYSSLLSPVYTLTVSVQDDKGTVTINNPVSLYYPGQKVTLTAQVQPDYIITGWSGGTANDASIETTNTVVMTESKTIVVQVRQRRTLYLGGSSTYSKLQEAVDAALDGDTIRVLPGVYMSDALHPGGPRWQEECNIDLQGKSLQIIGTNPVDPEVVRATEFNYFRFMLNDVGPDTLIEGITIRRSRMEILRSSPTIRNCLFLECRWFGGVTDPPGDGCALDGGDGDSVLGGAVRISESSPKFINCTFDNNTATGGIAASGNPGCEVHPTGGDGGWGGRAYGGAVYAGFRSKPVFDHCTFIGNETTGGKGGNGGAGWIPPSGYQYHGGRGGSWNMAESQEKDPSLFGWWDGWSYGDKYWLYQSYFNLYGKYDWAKWTEWFSFDKWTSWDDFFGNVQNTYYYYYQSDPYDKYEEYWKYSGYGGAVYCAYDTQAEFISCKFESNQSHGGLSGMGGAGGYNSADPDRQLTLPNAGGAVYAAYDSKLEFSDCTFTNNLSDRSAVQYPTTYSLSFGGAVAYEFDCQATFTRCSFGSNEAAIGGGIYSFESKTTITDSNSVDNSAYTGAGLYVDSNTVDVTNTTFERNRATTPPAILDPNGDPNNPADYHSTLAVVGQGGGMYVGSANLTLKDSIFVENQADISGAGLYLTGESIAEANIFNSLFVKNKARRDGGGISANWYSRPTIANCTFADNATGSLVNPVFDGTGAGLYLAYDCRAVVKDSIFFDNDAVEGSQITVGTGFTLSDPRPSQLMISYSDVQDRSSSSSLFVGENCTLVQGSGMLSALPLFESLPDSNDFKKDYYLKAESPCVNAGSVNAQDVGLLNYTTSIQSAKDKGKVNLGYHYKIGSIGTSCGDIDQALALNGQIDIRDFAVLAKYWLNTNCSDPGWCGGADLNFDQVVDTDDFANMTTCWLVSDMEPPLPNPAQWVVEPNAVPDSFTAIDMKAVVANDAWWLNSGIQYKFDCTNDPNQSSQWRTDPNFSLTGLTPGRGYTFKTKSRDGSLIETDYSVEKTVVVGSKKYPTPSPAQWLVMPKVLDNSTATMQAAAYTGGGLPAGVVVEYQFVYTGSLDGGTTSNWQTNATYNDTGLVLGNTYTYQVVMRLRNTAAGEISRTQPSVVASVLMVAVDSTPPTPDPAIVLSVSAPFNYGGVWYQEVIAAEAEDPNGVEYKFTSTDGAPISGNNALWRYDVNATAPTPRPAGTVNCSTLVYPTGATQTARIIWVPVGSQFGRYTYRVQYRDQSPALNTGQVSASAQAP